MLNQGCILTAAARVRTIVYWRARAHFLSQQKLRSRVRTLYTQFVSSGDLCFDVGANVGDRTRALVELGATVVSIDPQAYAVRRLNAQFGDNAHVNLVAKALGDEPGHATLHLCDAAPTISTMSSAFQTRSRFAGHYKWTRSARVEVTTLDALIAEYGIPVFCKIDVEGYELQVLLGLSQPIRTVSFEWAREAPDVLTKCLGRLSDLGADRFNLSLGERHMLEFPSWVDRAELTRMMSLIDDQVAWGDVYGTCSKLQHNNTSQLLQGAC